MGALRRLSEIELAQLDEGELIEYAVVAREAGMTDEATLALRIFAFGVEAQIRAFVRMRLDSHGEPVIDDVAEKVLEDAIRSIVRLRGSTAAEARAFVFRIARRRIADFHRTGRLNEVPFEAGTDEDAGDEPPFGKVEGESDAVETRLLVDEALAELRDDHRLVVELFVLRGYTASETAEEVARRFGTPDHDSMSEQNVHQIGSRFRKEIRARLEMAEGGVTADDRS